MFLWLFPKRRRRTHGRCVASGGMWKGEGAVSSISPSFIHGAERLTPTWGDWWTALVLSQQLYNITVKKKKKTRKQGCFNKCITAFKSLLDIYFAVDKLTLIGRQRLDWFHIIQSEPAPDSTRCLTPHRLHRQTEDKDIFSFAYSLLMYNRRRRGVINPWGGTTADSGAGLHFLAWRSTSRRFFSRFFPEVHKFTKSYSWLRLLEEK